MYECGQVDAAEKLLKVVKFATEKAASGRAYADDDDIQAALTELKGHELQHPGAGSHRSDLCDLERPPEQPLQR